MNKKLVLIISCLFCVLICTAQSQRLWATYYGGTGIDYGIGIATDSLGNIYMAGLTASTGMASGGFQNTYGGGTSDGLLVKFDTYGNRLWATYYGRGGNDLAYSVAVDATGNVYLAGYTSSTIGIASGGFQNTYGGGGLDAFLVKFDSDGNRLWATYYGSTGDDYALSVTVDAWGNVYMSGHTNSANSIASGGFQNTFAGDYDVFIVKFDSAGNRQWATYYGGDDDDRNREVITDILGNVYITGFTYSTSDIASGGFQNTHTGTIAAYLVKFDSLSNRIWGTYYGNNSGTGISYGWGVAIDSTGHVYLAGQTGCTSGIASGGFQNTHGGSLVDAMLIKFDSTGNRIWGTYYGGAAFDYFLEIALDSAQNVFVTGDSYSNTGVSIPGAFQENLIGEENQILVKFDPAGQPLYATYYGLNHDEEGKLALDNSGNVYMTGRINGIGLASGGFQNNFGGGNSDAHLVKFGVCSNYNVFFTGLEGSYCSNADSILLIGSPAGGTFNGPGISGNYFVPSLADIGFNEITYTYSDPNGCTTTSQITSVNISDSPIASFTFTNNDPVIDFTETASNEVSWNWNFGDGTKYSNSQNPSHIYSGPFPETYYATLCVTAESGCQSCSTDSVTILPTSISEGISDNKLEVFPNPASIKLTLQSELLSENTEIRVYNARGQEVFVPILLKEGKGAEIYIMQLPDGVYDIYLINKQGVISKKIVKQ